MEPTSAVTVSILASARLLKAIHDVAFDEVRALTKQAMGTGVRNLFYSLRPTARQEASTKAVQLFAEAWQRELEDTTVLTSALSSYSDQLEGLLTAAAPEIAEWMDPVTKGVDLDPIKRIWSGIPHDDLPEEFEWSHVALMFGRAIRKEFRDNPKLRAAYILSLEERETAAVERFAGPEPGFDLLAYRRFLIQNRCNGLHLAAMHASTFDLNRKLTLWRVFVEPSARESAPVLDIAPEILRRIRQTGQNADTAKKAKLDQIREHYQSSPIRPVFQILDRERLVVITGDPGSGKSSLLRYRALQWANENKGPVPLFIDLKDYARDRRGLLEYCQSGCEFYHLDAAELERLLSVGSAAFYLDGLDEIFDLPTRDGVVKEIVVLAVRYSHAPAVVTSRKLGYDPGPLTDAGFFHATLEDFDEAQMRSFLLQWNALAEEDDKEQKRLYDRLISAIAESRAINELAGNPLLLTMIAILNRHQELPRDRVELYREASRVLLHHWSAQKALPADTFARQEKESLLRKLAGDMQQAEGGLAGNLIHRDRLILLIREFLDQLRIEKSYEKALALVQQLTERNFILAYAGEDHFCFVHRTFLEYFCAEWFVERLGHKEGGDLYLSFDRLREEVFGNHWRDKTWHEVLRLIAGIVHETRADELIQFLMKQNGSEDRLANLMLAAGCLYEVRNRAAIQPTDQALWQLLTNRVIRFKSPRETWITINTDDISFAIERWEVIAEAIKWIAATWRNANARDWLRSAARVDRDRFVRRSAIRELSDGWKNDPETFSLLLESAQGDRDETVRSEAIRNLEDNWSNRTETMELVKDRAKSDSDRDVRETALSTLVNRWHDNPETLKILKAAAQADRDSEIRSWSIRALTSGWAGDTELLVMLKNAARDEENPAVREALATAIASGWPKNADVLMLLKKFAKSDPNDDVRHRAVIAIANGWPDDLEVLSLLKHRAHHFTLDYQLREVLAMLRQHWPEDPEVIAFTEK